MYKNEIVSNIHMTLADHMLEFLLLKIINVWVEGQILFIYINFVLNCN